MNPQDSRQPKPLDNVRRAFSNLFGLAKNKGEYETPDPVKRVREGLSDLNAGRVHKIERASDLFDDE